MRHAGTFYGWPLYAQGSLIFLHDGERWAIYALGHRVTYGRAR
jgi:hypothetical protein